GRWRHPFGDSRSGRDYVAAEGSGLRAGESQLDERRVRRPVRADRRPGMLLAVVRRARDVQVDPRLRDELPQEDGALDQPTLVVAREGHDVAGPAVHVLA